MHRNSQLLFEKYAKPLFRPGMTVLEIGPNTIPSTYQKLVGLDSVIWHTLDLTDAPGLTHRSASEYSFPIPDDTYDLVLSGQVIEHVRRVWVWIREVARVCKPGGTVVTINPVSWPYHEAPVDCWRIYPEGMRSLYEEASLDVVRSLWESLEAGPARDGLPGRSVEWQPVGLRRVFRVLGFLGYPVERAYDTITIGTKRPVASTAG